jgi:hypothetical protein
MPQSEVRVENNFMQTSHTHRSLQVVLITIGILFVAGLFPLTLIWPSGWAWHVGGQSMYLQMILGIYGTLGVFLMIAARNPQQHLSVIWFTVWSSVVHAGIMTAQALVYPEHRGHLLGDVPALLLIAMALTILTPRAANVAAKP